MKSPSEEIQEKLASAVSDAIRESFDWDAADKILTATLGYIQRCLNDAKISSCGPLYFSSSSYIDGEDTPYPDGLRLNFEICDETVTIVRLEDVSLAVQIANEYPDCFRSQAALVWALERTVEVVKARFKDDFGIECTKEAVDAEHERKWSKK